ncbi:MAG: class I SAM-dependent methyltransferase [Gammaproteobacteria bacterium]|nr:class I SAM-dependent methyltransferase [Gammaproteobacteria bacterium]
MGLKFSYTLLSPIYDLIVASPTENIRTKSLQRLHDFHNKRVLINGIGSGLDIPFLPAGPLYTCTDLTPAMLKRAQQRADQSDLDLHLELADAMDLTYKDQMYDAVVLHLILAVVPQPVKALQEASRVLKPGGKIFILDKFIKPGQLALARRLLNPFIRHIATRTDIVFEHLHKECNELKLLQDEPVLMNGWFRSIELEKREK